MLGLFSSSSSWFLKLRMNINQFARSLNTLPTLVMAKLRILRTYLAELQWGRLAECAIAGMGIFIDTYDMYCMSFVSDLLGRIYYQVDGAPKPGTLPPIVLATLYAIAFCGSFLGQLFFSWMGDKTGKKRVYGITLMTMIIFSIGSGFSFGHTTQHVIVSLCFFRFGLGFGMGGDYLTSTSIMSKLVTKKSHSVAAVFVMQWLGFLAGGLFTMLVATIFRAKYNSPSYAVDPVGSTVLQADNMWRILLMTGVLPAAVTYYWRMKMSETSHFTALVANNTTQAAEPNKEKEDKEKFGCFSMEFARRHGLILLCTAAIWFCLYLTFYSQNIFQKDILSAIDWIPPSETMNAFEEVYRVARAQTVIALVCTGPGYIFTVILIDKIGRFATQLMGFFFMAVLMFALAIPYDRLTNGHNHIVFDMIYMLTFFFANFGPNAIMFVVPEEIFPARFRSTCNVISAAAGNLGAIFGAFGFMFLAQHKDQSKASTGYPAGIGVKNSLFVVGGVYIFGFFCTFFLRKEYRKVLEKIKKDEATEVA